MSARKITLNADDILIREGDHSKSMFWVQKGQLVVTKKRLHEEVILGHVMAGELVGEISFLDLEPRSATVNFSKSLKMPLRQFLKLNQNGLRYS
jgi:CRP-like cAMP-binding protein